MTGADYVINVLEKNNVKHVFGIPGASVMDFLYAADRAKGIEVHLSYHEQAAAFAASGYAQVSGNVGVVYATKGPGFLNTLTAIGDCFFDSVPLVVITAHSKGESGKKRFLSNQEVKTGHIAEAIAKAVVVIDKKGDLGKIDNACKCAREDRKGSVVIDISTDILKGEIENGDIPSVDICNNEKVEDISYIVDEIKTILKSAKRPVILIGAGITENDSISKLKTISESLEIPLLSSRISQDKLKHFDNYYGYIGSRGIRTANFVLEKADFILSLGNRMAYPPDSISYKNVMENKKVVRIDIDENEFERKIPNSTNYISDANRVIDVLYNNSDCEYEWKEWKAVCDKLKESLWKHDISEPVKKISEVIESMPEGSFIVGDVGNNAIWLSKAYSIAKNSERLLYPHSFAALGSAICRSIGVYYASGLPVFCFMGDQGFQLNIQELQYLSFNKIPVCIVLINNKASGMIRNWEVSRFGYDVHTTQNSGYGIPDINALAKAYDIKCIEYIKKTDIEKVKDELGNNHPVILTIEVDEKEAVYPSLPIGNPCSDLAPLLSREEYNYYQLL